MEIKALTALTPVQLEQMAPLDLDHALNVHPAMPSYFQAWEGSTLVGALSLFTPLTDTAEAGAFVPEPRRRSGVFTALLAQAEPMLREYGFQALLFPCAGDSPDGQAVAAHWGLPLDHSEYLLTHVGPRPACPEGVTLETATEEDLEELTALSAAAFGDDPAESRRMTLATLRAPALRCHVLRSGGAVAAMASVNLESEVLSIYNVVAAPGLRGRGWGRKLMTALLAALPTGRAVSIEADSGNAAALGLYRACGFTERRREDYYRRAL